jgi:hypothetical protein
MPKIYTTIADTHIRLVRRAPRLTAVLPLIVTNEDGISCLSIIMMPLNPAINAPRLKADEVKGPLEVAMIIKPMTTGMLVTIFRTRPLIINLCWRNGFLDIFSTGNIFITDGLRISA